MPSQEERINELIRHVPRITPLRKKIVRACYDLNGPPRTLIQLIRQDHEIERKVLKFYREHARGQDLGGLRPSQVSLEQAVVPLGVNTVKEIALSHIMSGGR